MSNSYTTNIVSLYYIHNALYKYHNIPWRKRLYTATCLIRSPKNSYTNIQTVLKRIHY